MPCNLTDLLIDNPPKKLEREAVWIAIVNCVLVSPECGEKPLIDCNGNVVMQEIFGVVIGE